MTDPSPIHPLTSTSSTLASHAQVFSFMSPWGILTGDDLFLPVVTVITGICSPPPPSPPPLLIFFSSPPTKLWTKMWLTIGKTDWMSTLSLTCRACQESGNVVFLVCPPPPPAAWQRHKRETIRGERQRDRVVLPEVSAVRWRGGAHRLHPPPHPYLSSPSSGLFAKASLWLC